MELINDSLWAVGRELILLLPPFGQEAVWIWEKRQWRVRGAAGLMQKPHGEIMSNLKVFFLLNWFPSSLYGPPPLKPLSPFHPLKRNVSFFIYFIFKVFIFYWGIGEGNGNPLQCSCLEDPRDGGACWAAVSGVAQSRTRLKRLSSSRSRAN